MKKGRQVPSLDRPATYQIKVPGHLGENWTEWDGNMVLTFKVERDGSPVTILTGALDQAALHGLMRRLYALGLPLISVICLECGSERVDLSRDNYR